MIVEAVRQFVADDRSDAAEVDRHVGGAVIEGRLQNAGREIDVVFERTVISVDGRRRHIELLTIDGLAYFGKIALNGIGARVPYVGGVIRIGNIDRGVAFPLFRIADFVGYALQFQ